MAKLSEKYLAGFLDADGCINVARSENMKYPRLTLDWMQKTSQDEVLQLIKRDYGAFITTHSVNGIEYSTARIAGKEARMLLSRIAQYLVVKRHYANVVLDVLDKPITDHKEFSQWLKEQRRIKSLPLPNYPARKWLAGFFDGDGCVSVQELYKNTGAATLVAVVSTSGYDTESIELLHKAFGGSIHGMKGRECQQWKLIIVPSKAKEFIGYFAKYSIVKKSQLDFILNCAAMGHYRDGENIKAALKQLKAYEHRLSETKPYNLNDLMATVRDLPKKWERSGQFDCCIKCGTTTKPHLSKGMCSPCYQKEWLAVKR